MYAMELLHNLLLGAACIFEQTFSCLLSLKFSFLYASLSLLVRPEISLFSLSLSFHSYNDKIKIIRPFSRRLSLVRSQ